MVIGLIKNRLIKTRQFLLERLAGFSGRTEVSKEIIAELEAMLIQADLGVLVTNMVIKEIEKRKMLEKDEVFSITRDILLKILKTKDNIPGICLNPNGPTVILLLGVNGTGKTTTAAKLAHRFKSDGKKVLLAAGDTFRAAAIEQLEIWADRIGVDFVKHVYKADTSAVCFDAMKAAITRKMDYLIIDTAGRFHTRTELVDELKKIERTLNKVYPGAPHEKIIVIDATTGQNALVQTRQFHEAINLTGIIVTKLDGTAKGGMIVGIEEELGIPVKFIGFGQDLSDIEEFDPESYVSAIV